MGPVAGPREPTANQPARRLGHVLLCRDRFKQGEGGIGTRVWPLRNSAAPGPKHSMQGRRHRRPGKTADIDEENRVETVWWVCELLGRHVRQRVNPDSCAVETGVDASESQGCGGVFVSDHTMKSKLGVLADRLNGGDVRSAHQQGTAFEHRRRQRRRQLSSP